MNNNIKTLVLAMIMGSAVLSSCKKEETEPIENNGMVIDNNVGARMTVHGDDLIYPIVEYGQQSGRNRSASVDSTSNYNLSLVAEITSPSLNGVKLRATHIEVVGTKAYVSYNTESSAYAGAIDVIDMSNAASPVLSQSALLNNIDISALTVSNTDLFFAGARDVDKLTGITSPAFVGKIGLNAGAITTNVSYKEIGGYVANSVSADAGSLYISSGNTNGGVFVMDKNTLNVNNQINVDGVKDVSLGTLDFATIDGAYEGSATQKLNIYNKATNTLVRSVALPAGINSEAKVNIAPWATNMLVANGFAGITYWNPVTGVMMDRIGLPASITGVDPGDIYTNSVSVDNNYVYAANGAAGLLVGKVMTSNTELAVLGRADVDGSANYVKAANGYIYVASGKGGVKIFKLELKNSGNTSAPGCSGRPALQSNQFGYYTVNTNDKQYFNGSTILGGLNVNSNGLFDYCGSLVLNYWSSTNAVFVTNGSLVCNQGLNINSGGVLKVYGSVVINGDLNFNGTIEFMQPGCTFTVNGRVNKNSGAQVINAQYYTGTAL